MLKASDVKGLVPYPLIKPEEHFECSCMYCGNIQGFNQAHEDMLSKEFYLERENLAAELYTAKGGNYHMLSDTDKVLVMGDCYREADFLIQSFNAGQLLRVVEKEGK